MLKKFSLAILFSLFLPPLFGAPVFAEKAEDYILKGSALVQKKEYKKATVEYEQAIKLSPKNSRAHLLLGLTYANIGEFEKAVKYSQNSLAIEPSFPAYHNLGLIYANKGELDKARDAYEKALKINPESYRAWYELALVHASASRFADAVTAYKNTIERNVQFGDAYLGLGSSYYWLGDKASAQEMVKRLASLKMKTKADELQSWINDKESRKTEASKVEAPKTEPSAK